VLVFIHFSSKGIIMSASKPQNTSNNMGMYQNGQNQGYQGFGQMPNMMANMMGNPGQYYGNQSNDMQMPWMNQFQNQNFNQSQPTGFPPPAQPQQAPTQQRQQMTDSNTVGVDPNTGRLTFRY